MTLTDSEHQLLIAKHTPDLRWYKKQQVSRRRIHLQRMSCRGLSLLKVFLVIFLCQKAQSQKAQKAQSMDEKILIFQPLRNFPAPLYVSYPSQSSKIDPSKIKPNKTKPSKIKPNLKNSFEEHLPNLLQRGFQRRKEAVKKRQKVEQEVG